MTAQAPSVQAPRLRRDDAAKQWREVRAHAAETGNRLSGEVAVPATGSDVPIAPEKLLEMTRDYTVGVKNLEEQAKLLDDDYVFRGPAIGPFNKSDYVRSLTKVGAKSAFPDMKFKTWGHSVDPDNPLRVWYFAQISGTMTKDWDVNGQFFPATNKPIQSAPEAHSIEWTADGKVRYQSVGYCVDRFYSGSPDGSMTVAVFAAFKAANNPWVVKVLMNPLFETFMALIGDPQATPWENLPEWYQELPGSRLKGSQGISRV